MKTLNDLKENREVIIDTITEEVGAENVKEVMTILASYVGFNGYFEKTAEQFTKAVIKDSGIDSTIINRNGSKAQAFLENYNIEMSKRQMQNI